MGPGRVPSRAAECDLDLVRGAGDRTHPETHLACFQRRIDVVRQKGMDAGGGTLVAESDRSTGQLFLGRLEDDADRPGKIRQLREDLGDADGNGCVGVMPTGVHHAGYLGPVGNCVLLFDGESVEISAKPDRGATGSHLHAQPHAVLANLRFQPQRSQGLGEAIRRPALRPTELGMAMEVAAQLYRGRCCFLRELAEPMGLARHGDKVYGVVLPPVMPPWRPAHRSGRAQPTTLPTEGGDPLQRPSFTVGIEEEYFLVDRQTRDLVPDMPEGFLRAAEEIVEGMVSPEFLRSQVEIGTPVSKDIAEVKGPPRLRSPQRGRCGQRARNGDHLGVDPPPSPSGGRSGIPTRPGTTCSPRHCRGSCVGSSSAGCMCTWASRTRTSGST